MESWENNVEIQRFRKYLQIPTVHPDIDYEPCIQFLKEQAIELGLSVLVHHPSSKKDPIIVISLTGSDPSLPSIMLNSHMDVVPVYKDKWTHPPFAADIDDDGRIFARGAQDMKSVGTQYLSALKALKAENILCRRTIHITYVPGEEISCVHGMMSFVKTDAFRQLNVGFCLDEGMPSPTDSFLAFYAERCIWQITFKIHGNSGHGSLLHSNTPGEKFRYLLDRMMDMRADEIKRLETNPELTVGDVTTINLTMVHGGVQVNVVPFEMEASFDMRLSSNLDQTEFYSRLERWCNEAGGDITIEFIQKTPYVEPTKLDSSNPYWMAFKSAMDELGLEVKKQVFAGGTDGSLVRELGIPTIGFSPINKTPVLLHDHDEYIKADIYLRGIDIYKKVIEKVANV